MAAKMTTPMKMEAVLEAAAKQDSEGEKARNLGDIIWKTCGLENMQPTDSPVADRPFLPPLVWALYSAYSQVLMRPILQIAAIRTGAGADLLADPKPIIELVKSAMPHFAKYIDEYGAEGLTELIDELEETLLREIQRTLHNPDADQSNLEQAAAILKAADKLTETSPENLVPPGNFAK